MSFPKKFKKPLTKWGKQMNLKIDDYEVSSGSDYVEYFVYASDPITGDQAIMGTKVGEENKIDDLSFNFYTGDSSLEGNMRLSLAVKKIGKFLKSWKKAELFEDVAEGIDPDNLKQFVGRVDDLNGIDQKAFQPVFAFLYGADNNNYSEYS